MEAVSLMVRVAHDVEQDPALKSKTLYPIPEVFGYPRLSEAIGQSACRLAETVDAAGILAFSYNFV